jgi:hypothetical protein
MKTRMGMRKMRRQKTPRTRRIKRMTTSGMSVRVALHTWSEARDEEEGEAGRAEGDAGGERVEGALEAMEEVVVVVTREEAAGVGCCITGL